jgi:hypothetical protein
MLTYLLTASTYMVLNFVLYRVVYHRLTFFTWNRLLLLGLLVIALGAPMVHTPLSWGERLPQTAVGHGFPEVQHWLKTGGILWGVHVAPPVHRWSLFDWFCAVYFAGVLWMSVRFGSGVVRIVRMKRLGRAQHVDGLLVIRSQGVNASFFRWIFVYEGLHGEAYDTVLEHERYHALHWHTLDNLWMECLKILFWFHPLVYRFHKLLRETHEWETDAHMSRYMDARRYAHLLVHLGTGLPAVRLCNGYHASSLPKRIHVIFNKPSRAMKKLMYFFVAPGIALSFVLIAPYTLLAQQGRTVLPVVHVFDFVKTEPGSGVWFDENDSTTVMILSLREIAGPEASYDRFRKFAGTDYGRIVSCFITRGWNLTFSTKVDPLNNLQDLEYHISGTRDEGPSASARFIAKFLIDNDYVIVCAASTRGELRVVSTTKDRARSWGYNLPANF